MTTFNDVIIHAQNLATGLWDLFGPMLIERLPDIAIGIYGAWATKDWFSLKKKAEQICFDMVDQTISNDEKLNKATSILYSQVPMKLKMLPFVNEATIRNLVKTIYSTRVRPEVKAKASSQAIDVIDAASMVGNAASKLISSGVVEIKSDERTVNF